MGPLFVEKGTSGGFVVFAGIYRIFICNASLGVPAVKCLVSVWSAFGWVLERSAAYDLSEQQAEIDNFAGWLISAIRDGYQASTTEQKSAGKTVKKTGTKTSKKKKKPQFSDFEQTEYDFDELEEKLTAN